MAKAEDDSTVVESEPERTSGEHDENFRSEMPSSEEVYYINAPEAAQAEQIAETQLAEVEPEEASGQPADPDPGVTSDVGAEAVGTEAVGVEAVGAEAVGAEAVGAEAVPLGAATAAVPVSPVSAAVATQDTGSKEAASPVSLSTAPSGVASAAATASPVSAGASPAGVASAAATASPVSAAAAPPGVASAAAATAANLGPQTEGELPAKKSEYKSGGLRTTVNTPKSLIDEIEPAEEDADAEQYMAYAQQYAQLAQQCAAYAQHYAALAPQLRAQQEAANGGGSSSSSGGAASSSGGGGASTNPAAGAGDQTSRNTPIMVTPYRHNWLISGAHRDENGEIQGNFMSNFSADVVSTMRSVASVLGADGRSCCSMTPADVLQKDDCKQM
eukprot:TRINITY_DN14933_c0_g2_i1.p1 TRINITY_DN14933_c0_g2~~TRINITY_DN14933_c0_g2_i1.p1  ORF type:complete len:388 (+),score=129.82 TRINITY_DN14933_c0_g2_i1:78-1241(+)